MSRRPYLIRYAQLQELLVSARRSADLTQTDVAKRLGRPQSFVSKYENGERRLDVVEFVDVCTALEIEPVQVLGHLTE